MGQNTFVSATPRQKKIRFETETNIYSLLQSIGTDPSNVWNPFIVNDSNENDTNIYTNLLESIGQDPSILRKPYNFNASIKNRTNIYRSLLESIVSGKIDPSILRGPKIDSYYPLQSENGRSGIEELIRGSSSSDIINIYREKLSKENNDGALIIFPRTYIYKSLENCPFLQYHMRLRKMWRSDVVIYNFNDTILRFGDSSCKNCWFCNSDIIKCYSPEYTNIYLPPQD